MDPYELKKVLWKAKQNGFTDIQLAHIWNRKEADIRQLREEHGVLPVFKLVDTCAAEFEAYTPYYYSTYETPHLIRTPEGNWVENRESEKREAKRQTVMILGGGANRIGQGIEFDYCCCHAAFALREAGYDTVMVNSNPETVSTDYDTSTRLYFEPLTFEHVMNIVEVEKPLGLIVQFGGQTPLNLSLALEAAGVPILGTSPASIDKTEDRKFFGRFLEELGIRQPEGGTATSFEEALEVARRIGFPVLVRPSFVLGGRAMEIVYDEDSLKRYIANAVEASPERPILVDRFLDDAIEVDVDAISDGKQVVIGGIMEHIEQAGIHSGDSACVLPPRGLAPEVLEEIRVSTVKIAKGLDVCGLMNIQFAVQHRAGGEPDAVYVLEVNPRASRTIPFVSKATGVPLARLAALVMVGQTLDELGFTEEVIPTHFSVKEAVLPFVKFAGVDALLGPEMRSTGEVMGIANSFGAAYAKAQRAAGSGLPHPPDQGAEGRVFLSVNDRHKAEALDLAKRLIACGFEIVATQGTLEHLASEGVEATAVFKVHEGRPNIVDRIKNGEIHLVINTPLGAASKYDEKAIRRAAVECGVPYTTTISAAKVAMDAIEEAIDGQDRKVLCLQDWHRQLSQTA